MSDHNVFRPKFTYLSDGNTVTADLSDLLPERLYRFLCRCGCGEVFERTGAELKSCPEVPATTSSVVTTTSTAETSAVVIDEDDLDCEDAVTEHSADAKVIIEAIVSRTKERDEALVNAPRPEPVIGDTVWSKATGHGPFIIIAGTFIDVRAAKLEISTPEDGVYIRERTRSDEILRLDAWLVRDGSGRTSAFPKAELTIDRQFQGPSMIKIMIWATTFATFATMGWFLHH
jgi:hypothetical protein